MIGIRICSYRKRVCYSLLCFIQINVLTSISFSRSHTLANPNVINKELTHFQFQHKTKYFIMMYRSDSIFSYYCSMYVFCISRYSITSQMFISLSNIWSVYSYLCHILLTFCWRSSTSCVAAAIVFLYQLIQITLKPLLSIYLSIYIYIYICLYLSIDLSVCLSGRPSARPSVHPSIHPSIHLSFYAHTHIHTHMCVCVIYRWDFVYTCS